MNSSVDIENRTNIKLVQSDKVTNTHVTKQFKLICISIATIFIMGFFFALPIAEIIMAEKYRNLMKCPNNIISPYNWMITEGVVGIMIYGLVGIKTSAIIISNVVYNSKNSEIFSIIFSIPLIMLSVFHLAWIIVGAVMFLRDCINLKTKSMNDFYWAVLIINLVSIYLPIHNYEDKK